MKRYRIALLALCLVAGCISGLHRISAQQATPKKLDTQDMQRAHVMLKQTYDEVKKNYYDPTFHGVDLDATYHQLDTRLNSAQSINDSFHVIAAFLMQLHDSHTFFEPPARKNHSTLGYDMEMVGDRCFVTHIRPNVDAAKKLHVGDQVLALNGFGVRRADFWNMRYFYQTLSPAPAEMLDLQDAAGAQRKETIQATLRTGKAILDLTDEGNGADFWQLVRADEESDHLNRQRYVENGDTLIWKMPSFETDFASIETMFTKARKHQNLVLDLRDNPGGSEDILKLVLGHLFDHDIKLADRVSRKGTKPIMVKTQPKEVFTGRLIVLVNSESSSAAELLARVVQLEKRGTVVGDISSGFVMQAQDFTEQIGTDYQVLYGLSVTSANLLMTDGKSIENVGVTPDDVMIPTAQDLADGKDPVLAHAMQLAGLTTDPVAAGKLFPYEWPDL